MSMRVRFRFLSERLTDAFHSQQWARKRGGTPWLKLKVSLRSRRRSVLLPGAGGRPPAQHGRTKTSFIVETLNNLAHHY